jgi:hypothetical protein
MCASVLSGAEGSVLYRIANSNLAGIANRYWILIDDRECLLANIALECSGEIPGALSAGISFGKACLRRANFGHRNAR